MAHAVSLPDFLLLVNLAGARTGHLLTEIGEDVMYTEIELHALLLSIPIVGDRFFAFPKGLSPSFLYLSLFPAYFPMYDVLSALLAATSLGFIRMSSFRSSASSHQIPGLRRSVLKGCRKGRCLCVMLLLEPYSVISSVSLASRFFITLSRSTSESRSRPIDDELI